LPLSLTFNEGHARPENVNATGGKFSSHQPDVSRVITSRVDARQHRQPARIVRGAVEPGEVVVVNNSHDTRERLDRPPAAEDDRIAARRAHYLVTVLN
jgi:hypothetical protein